ncbi:MAG: hypothetical protein NTZ04_03390 [Chloroflexi bacterium]|nr:hypothetical protein [Chloroflexota bacterium]
MDKKPKTEGLTRKGAPARGRSRWGREKRWLYTIEAIIVLTIIAVPAIVGYGYYDTRIKPWRQPIVRVNDTVFDMGYLVKMLRLQGMSSTSTASDVESIATYIQDNELMKQGLKKDFGVVISDGAIEEKLQEILSSSSMTVEKLKTNLATAGISVEDFKQMYIKPSLVQSGLRQGIGDRDYPADREFEHVRVQAMLVVGADNATAVRDRWLADEDFNTLVTDYSPSKYYPNTSSDNTTVEWIPRGIESTAFDDYAFAEGSENSTVSEPILESEGSESYWVIKVLEKGLRLLSAGDRDTLIGDVFGKWLTDAKSAEANNMVSYLDDPKISWALDHIQT